MSKIEVNAIEPQCGTDLTVGASGDTITFPTGTTIVNNGTQTGFGRTGTVDWDTTPKTATFSAVSGNGYFCNTSGGAFTVNLPAGVAGAIISVADYAATWQTNNVTVTPNGTDKIGSVNTDVLLSTEGQSVTFVYVDSTQGWINTLDSTSNVRGAIPFIAATGGTITCSGDYRIHTFTGPGTFCVTSAGTPAGSISVDYMVVAGGGGAGNSSSGGGGGGAGGFRESSGSASGCYSASPLGGCVSALPVSVQGYPIVIGSGGTGICGPCAGGSRSTSGSLSSFSTITSAGGGFGGSEGPTPRPPGLAAEPGGSGGGETSHSSAPPSVTGSGNTPPVSPSQGNPGGLGNTSSGVPTSASGGGGGATAAGNPGDGSKAGGAGATTSISASSTAYGGGGGGASRSCAEGAGAGGVGGGGRGSNGAEYNQENGTVNTGGGAGGLRANIGAAANGGSGIVIIRYKFQ